MTISSHSGSNRFRVCWEWGDMMLEMFFVAVSAIADFYNHVDWVRANDFMTFVQTTLETCLVIGRMQENGDKKDDQGSSQS